MRSCFIYLFILLLLLLFFYIYGLFDRESTWDFMFFIGKRKGIDLGL